MRRIPTSSGRDPPGTPAAPTAVITDMTMTMIISGTENPKPKTWARNITVTPS
jgi:hypothetical protein